MGCQKKVGREKLSLFCCIQHIEANQPQKQMLYYEKLRSAVDNSECREK